jgi:hypothetical protein
MSFGRAARLERRKLARSYRWALHVLWHVRGKDSCYITAGASSEGRITIQILELR